MEPVTAAKAMDVVPPPIKVPQKAAEVRVDQREAANRDVINRALTQYSNELICQVLRPAK